MLTIVLLLAFIIALNKTRGWRARLKVCVSLTFVILFYRNLWILVPFDSAKWVNASHFERRLMAQNFLWTYDYKGMTADELRALFPGSLNNDYWLYFSQLNPRRPDHSSSVTLRVEFVRGKVKNVSSNPSVITPESLQFDPVRWREFRGRERALMAAELSNSNLLQDRTKKEIQTILGPPNEIGRLECSLGKLYWELEGSSLRFEVDHRDRVVKGSIKG